MRIQSPVLFVNQRLHLLLQSVLGKYDILDRQNNGEKTMYEYLKGIITKITAKYIVLEANGIGYILLRSGQSRNSNLCAPSCP